MPENHRVHPRYKYLAETAEQIARSYGADIVKLETFSHALFEDELVMKFLSEVDVDGPDVLKKNIENVREYRPKIVSDDRLEMTYELGYLLQDVDRSYTEKHAHLSEDLRALFALQQIVEKYPESKTAELLNSYNIKKTDISNFFDRKTSGLNPHISPSENALSIPNNVNYDYAIPPNSDTALAKYTSCLNDLAFDNKLNPTVGRSDEIQNVVRILRRHNKNNPMLLGEPGVGKTAIPEGIAQMAVRGELPGDLADLKIFSLDMAALVAGTTYRGDFEKRLKEVVAELSDTDGAILFIDEFHNLVGAGSASGSMDASNILKPALARGEISCIGATTYNEFRKYVEQDEALARRFKRIDVVEPSSEETYEILSKIKYVYEGHHYCEIPSDTLKQIIDMSVRYVTDRRLPDKAIDLMDESGAMLREIPQRNLTYGNTHNLPILTKDIVALSIAKSTGLPLEKINANDKQKVSSLSDTLNACVFGQEHAVTEVSAAYAVSRSGIGHVDKPIGSFLFTGPTGVGKTELAKILATHLDMKLIRLDMSEFMERHDASKLVGAAPGYVGYNEGGILTEAVHRNGNSVILLDEIEKAHPDIHNLLLQIMDNGFIKDSSGKSINFRNSIIIMTSNAGAGGKIVKSIGFCEQTETSTKANDINNLFSPEFRNRLDGLIQFNPLDKAVMPKILEKLVTDLSEKLDKQGISVTFTEEASEWLVNNGFDKQMGARPLSRIFDKSVRRPIAFKILESEAPTSITVSASNDGLIVAADLDVATDNAVVQNRVARLN